MDVTAYKDRWYGDTSRMFYVGNVSIKAKKLVETTYEAMMKGIKILKKEIHLGDIGSTIQKYVEEKGYSVVRDFCGHGIGEKFHKEPNILHYGQSGTGIKLKEGMIFTVEPMINEGEYQTKVLNDGWTAVTKDKKLSAQFEHTIGITKDGYEIFTFFKKRFEFSSILIMIERYSRKELKDIWEEKNKFSIWLKIEIAVAEAMEKLNIIPKGVSKKVKSKAKINVKRILEIEKNVKHDVIAFLTSISEKVGNDSKYLHKGMTSSDVLDTCFNLQLKQSGEILIKDMDALLSSIKKQSIKHKYTLCIVEVMEFMLNQLLLV